MTEKYYGHPKFYEMVEEEAELHSCKNRDYTRGGDPLGNFKRVSAVLKIWGFDVPPEVVALIYMMKQLDATMWMLSQKYEGEVETIDSRLADVSVYAKLARILKSEALTEEKDYLWVMQEDIASQLP